MSNLVKKLGQIQGVQTVKDLSVPKQSTPKNKKFWAEKIEQFDVETLIEIQGEMEKFVDLMRTEIDRLPDGTLDVSSLDENQLMEEYISYEKINAFIGARRDLVKELVFEKINQNIIDSGVETENGPENENGFIAVDELGKKFCREGAGVGNPTIDEDKLAEFLPEEVRDKVFKKKVIPEHVEFELDEDALMDYVSSEPESIGLIKQALNPGKLRSPRFVVRDLKR